MTRDEVREFFVAHGYTEDRWGSLTHPSEPSRRYRLRPMVLRREVRTSGGEWVRIRSGHYGQLSLTPEGRISGMRRWSYGEKS